jgi:glycosyltransferase involved in cell wall biosynthesis
MKGVQKVLISGGHELGGVGSVAAALAVGFNALGIPAEILSVAGVLSRWRDLQNPDVLKILSTGAVFAAPAATRAICIAHGVPCVAFQGWTRVSAIVASFKLANTAHVPVVAVSEYTAIHLRNLFGITIDKVILNPIKPIYLESPVEEPVSVERRYVTYVGRLHRSKNVHRLLPAICDLLEEQPDLRACVIGSGEMRNQLEDSVRGSPRVEFQGSPDDLSVREWLRRTRVFVSGNSTEGLGVSYLEAISQGCMVAMPASGGGMELALEQIGSTIHLLPLSLERRSVLAALRRAVSSRFVPIPLSSFEAKAAAASYLNLDSAQDSKDPEFASDAAGVTSFPR